ncbi:MAG: hypothetical protein R8K47_01880 [Mariprofundaceae bacterium]
MVEHTLYRLTGFPTPHWEAMVKPVIEGLDQDGLMSLRRALVIRQATYLPPGAEAEEIYARRDVWTYALIIGAVQCITGRKPTIPGIAVSWLQSDADCMRALDLLAHGMGVIHELLFRAGLVQSEQTEAIEEVDEQAECDAVAESSPAEAVLNQLVGLVRSDDIEIGKRGSALHIVPDGVLIDRKKAFRLLSDDWKPLDEAVAERFERRRYHPRSARDGVFIEGYVVPRALFEEWIPEPVEVDDLEECHEHA